jgi:DNA-binding CsgD family transcriptional regulator
MQTLALEGARRNARVNCLAPSAAAPMTAGILEPRDVARLMPKHVSPGLVALVADDAPTRMILLAGAGGFESAYDTVTPGVHVGDPAWAAEPPCGRLDEARSRRGEIVPLVGTQPYRLDIAGARAVAVPYGGTDDAAGGAQRAAIADEVAAVGVTADLLSGRQRHVLRLLAQGRSNKEIARALGVAPSTVKYHLRSVYAKLGICSRAQAALQARSFGLA